MTLRTFTRGLLIVVVLVLLLMVAEGLGNALGGLPEHLVR